MSWKKLDIFNYVKKIGEDEFIVVDVINSDNKFLLYEILIDLTSYSEEELEDYIDDPFPPLSQIKRQYGSDWKYAVAGILVFLKINFEEINVDNSVSFYDEKDIQSFLSENYTNGCDCNGESNC